MVNIVALQQEWVQFPPQSKTCILEGFFQSVPLTRHWWRSGSGFWVLHSVCTLLLGRRLVKCRPQENWIKCREQFLMCSRYMSPIKYVLIVNALSENINLSHFQRLFLEMTKTNVSLTNLKKILVFTQSSKSLFYWLQLLIFYKSDWLFEKSENCMSIFFF